MGWSGCRSTGDSSRAGDGWKIRIHVRRRNGAIGSGEAAGRSAQRSGAERAAQRRGERTPLACRFRRLAENLVPLTFWRGEKKWELGHDGWGGPPKPARGPRALPILISECGLNGEPNEG